MLEVVTLIVGIALLVGGGELFVRHAANIARVAGLSALVIGLTVVAFGTSAPEFSVGAVASLSDHPDTGLGNIIGSNIFNILVVLGLAAIISPIGVRHKLIRFDVPILIGATLLLVLVSVGGTIGRIESAVMLAALITYTAVTIFGVRRTKPKENTIANQPPTKAAVWLSILLLLVGLGILTVGSHLTVKAASALAMGFGVSELVIGLTVVAAGTSLPELVTSLVALRRNENDIAIGNVIGSSIFNILGVTSVMGLLSPAGVAVSEGARTFDLPFALAVAVICLPMFFTGYKVSRQEGLVLVAWYVAYVIFLALDVTGHDHLAEFNWIMFVLVVPPTLLLLSVFSWRYWQKR